MAFALGPIGQVSMSVDDVDAAERFYSQSLGLRKLYRYGGLLFYECAGVRLLIEKSNRTPFAPHSSVLYFRTADLALAVKALKARGIAFASAPHLIAPMEDHDLWMAFFEDAAGNTLALMQEAPKGYVVPAQG